MIPTEELDFAEAADGSGKWVVYAKNSVFNLGHIEWKEEKKSYDYVPNTNANLMKATHREQSRRELQLMCQELNKQRDEQGGNR
jgi:hypothetical protein